MGCYVSLGSSAALSAASFLGQGWMLRNVEVKLCYFVDACWLPTSSFVDRVFRAMRRTRDGEAADDHTQVRLSPFRESMSP